MRSVPDDLLPLIWHFLDSNDYKKAAKAFAKQVGRDLQSDIALESSLVDIYNRYLESKNNDESAGSSKESSSSDESTSESEEKAKEQTATEKNLLKHSKQIPKDKQSFEHGNTLPAGKDLNGSSGLNTIKPRSVSSAEPSSSESQLTSSSSESDSEKEAAPAKTEKRVSNRRDGKETSAFDKVSGKKRVRDESSSSSTESTGSDSSNSESESESEEPAPAKTIKSVSKRTDAKKKTTFDKASSKKRVRDESNSSSSESSGSDSSDSESESESEEPAPAKTIKSVSKRTDAKQKTTFDTASGKKRVRDESSSSSSENSDSDSSDSESKSEASEKTHFMSSSSAPNQRATKDPPSKKIKIKKQGSQSTLPSTLPTPIEDGRLNVPFSRVKKDEITFADESLRDNRFKAPEDSYGAKASRDLIVTRGKGFRTEKGKKKKGSYKGGKIDMESRSFKFS
ncbi:LisH domain-containing protein [Neolecta irregularis DAH-3]|uniref:LisH domain-containing protein n=1 Tax=Neolecta irregularis (strain DAH-3) TaxID=1198029 RepID=A0A1U7LIR7_NEOID|nr:LisH domain-containing protein [Neolecta irregularis DAH-3]|eukprot:OLL22442.1 LisH domain-containing protein [Neolecta irregularis DAH-3]